MTQGPVHSCSCGHDHAHGLHGHHHGPSSPHPAQAAPWSILRMALATRLIGALGLAAGLWVVVLLAMRAA